MGLANQAALNDLISQTDFSTATTSAELLALLNLPATLPDAELNALYGVMDALNASDPNSTGDPVAVPSNLPAATAGTPWTATIAADDTDGTQFFWQLISGPLGLTLAPSSSVDTTTSGYRNTATLQWTPTTRDLANTPVVIRLVDSRGGVALRTFNIPVTGGNHAPVISDIADITLTEGQSLSQPISASDADGNPLTISVRNLPAGASFNAATGRLNWTPSFDQAGDYQNVSIIVSDGKTTTVKQFNIHVDQGYAKPVFTPLATQTLREGDHFAVKLGGKVPGGLLQADGTSITLRYSAALLPGGATLNPDTGWFEWTPGFNQHGNITIPITLTATYTPADGSDAVTTEVVQNVILNVLNVNGAPEFAPVETQHILEGQYLQLSVFAFDADNPDFAPKLRLAGLTGSTAPNAAAAPLTDGEGSPSVTYQVTGLPVGATFDPDTLEILWKPDYTQAGTYNVTVTATDNGEGTGIPKSTQITIPIVVDNAYRSPIIGNIASAIVDRGATLDIPIISNDPSGLPVTLTVQGLPRFATFTQTGTGGAGSLANTAATATIHFAPGANDRGDYTITVIAQNDGGGDPSKALATSTSFVLTAASLTEPPVLSVPSRVVALVGQTLRIPIIIADPDQDALSYTATGLPPGAAIVQDPQYGRATIVWTPTASDVGSTNFRLNITDSGLPPQNAGITLPANFVPQPNTVFADIQIVVRTTNSVPNILTVQPSGGQVVTTVPANVTTATPATTTISATEGVALAVNVTVADTDFDAINWQVTGMPSGMTLETATGSSGGNNGQASAVLRWIPGYFAAQSSSTGGAGDADGTYHITLRATDGSASADQVIVLQVANTNQAPRILPTPLQLVREGETLGFTVQNVDQDGDPVTIRLLRDANTPAGVQFNSLGGNNAGYFEWTPDANTVNNLNATDGTFNFTFAATDGQATTLSTVQVRVFDVNYAPRIWSSNHALLVGQNFSLPISRGPAPNLTGSAAANVATNGLLINDPDGLPQTQALTIVFDNLPEGATYDAQTNKLNWIPGPGQVGDFTITARVSDGAGSTAQTSTQTFTLRVVADAQASAPAIVVDLTPSTPVLPGQTVLATVRASSYGNIASIRAQLQNADNTWTDLILDSAGRIKLAPAAPGLVNIRVTATDVDGFSNTTIQTIRVRDPQDKTAPTLAWGGALEAFSRFSSNSTSPTDASNPVNPVNIKPANITRASLIQARLGEQQLMGWTLEITPAGDQNSTDWTTLAEETTPASTVTGQRDLTELDPARLANGVYRLRLRAWDLQGRVSEIESRVIIDSPNKNLTQGATTDAVFQLGNHAFALTRALATDALTDALTGAGTSHQNNANNAFGNWTLPILDTQLTHDQAATDALGATNPWREGARVWLQVPGSLGTAATSATTSASTQYLSFTLGTQTESLVLGGAVANTTSNLAGRPTVSHPVFTMNNTSSASSTNNTNSTNNGWTLSATTIDTQNGLNGMVGTGATNTSTTSTIALQRQGTRLFDQTTGLPWQPAAYTLTGPDGTTYQLDATGKITNIQFTDGQQWIVSDAGIVLVDVSNTTANTNATTANATTTARVNFQRNDQGLIVNVTGISAGASSTNAGSAASADSGQSIAYRYDTQGRLILARNLAGTTILGGTTTNNPTGNQIGYHADGSLITDPITANLGAMVNWIAAAGANNTTATPTNTWTGTLISGTPINLSYTIRDSELASSIKTPGGTGSIIIAVTLDGQDVQLSPSAVTAVFSKSEMSLSVKRAGRLIWF
jgi:hypothetical protein